MIAANIVQRLSFLTWAEFILEACKNRFYETPRHKIPTRQVYFEISDINTISRRYGIQQSICNDVYGTADILQTYWQ